MGDFLEDYATTPVPDSISTSGYRLALINMSLAVGLPVMYAGMALARSIGFATALTMFLLGGLVIAAIGWGAATVGAFNRLSSYMIIGRVFGRQGAKLINTMFAASMWGWFGVNLTLFADAMRDVTGAPWPIEAFMAAGAVFMAGAATFGFKALNALSVAVVPVWALVMIILGIQVAGEEDLAARLPASDWSLQSIDEGISAVVGMLIVGAVLLPDFTRYARSDRAYRESAIAVLPAFAIVLPLVLVTAALAGVVSGANDPLSVLQHFGFGAFAALPIVLAATIVNGINLYGCSLSLNSVFPAAREWQLAIASGVVGTLAAMLGIIEHFIDFLEILSLVFTPIAGVYLVDFYLVRHRSPYREDRESTNWPALASVALAVGATALVHQLEWTLSGIKPCDALILSALVYAAFTGTLRRLERRRASRPVPG